MPEELSRQQCNLSNENDLKAAILERRAENKASLDDNIGNLVTITEKMLAIHSI